MSDLPVDAAGWQSLLDTNFPHGAVVSAVMEDGSLSGQVQYACPVLVVVAMRGEWPMLVGLAGDGMDVQLLPATWSVLDKNGHYVVRARLVASTQSRSGEVEISSWLSEPQIAAMAPFREPQRDWLLQVANSAEEETSLELTPAADIPGQAPSAEVDDSVTLTLTRI